MESGYSAAPSRTQTQINNDLSAGRIPVGAIVFNSSISVLQAHLGSGKFRNLVEPCQVVDTYWDVLSMPLYSEFTRTIELPMNGYQLARADLTGPGSSGSGIGKNGCSVRLRAPSSSAGYFSSLDISSYPSVLSAQTSPNQASAKYFDDSSSVFLRHAWLGSDGGTAYFKFYNDSAMSRKLKVKADVEAW